MRFSFFNQIIVGCFLFFSIGFGVVSLQAQEYNNSNITKSFEITVVENSDQGIVELEYNIRQDFLIPSRGIFIALPNVQGDFGSQVWVDYSVLNIQKRLVAKSLESPKNELNPIESVENNSLNLQNKNTAWQDEKYENIKENDELRIRIGDPDVTFTGEYEYRLNLLAKFPKNVKFDLILLQNWRDNIESIKVFGTKEKPDNLCERTIECSANSTKITINKDGQIADWSFTGQIVAQTILPYFAVFGAVLGLLCTLWNNIARDPLSRRLKDKPHFEPPAGILPWEAQFLASDGLSDLKNTLLSYILYLNHKGYIKLVPIEKKSENAGLIDNIKETLGFGDDSENVQIEIIQDLPAGLLPKIFDETIVAISELGIKEGLLSTKINPQYSDFLDTFLSQKLKRLHDNLPLQYQAGFIIGISAGFGFLLFLLFQVLRGLILLGNSYIPVFWFAWVLIIVATTIMVRYWGKLNSEGVEIRDQIEGYKYYLNHVEKYKLDFSNNPNDGVQYYLLTVPFAAAFGIMPQFREYIAKLIPNSSEVATTGGFVNNYAVSSFYVPPSSNSGSSGGFSSGGGFSGGGGSW
jgi:Predicted membrane protein (DUF2207)